MASTSTIYVRARLISTKFCSRHWDITVRQSNSYINTGTAAEAVQCAQDDRNEELDVIEYRINENRTSPQMEGIMRPPPHLTKQQSNCGCTSWV